MLEEVEVEGGGWIWLGKWTVSIAGDGGVYCRGRYCSTRPLLSDLHTCMLACMYKRFSLSLEKKKGKRRREKDLWVMDGLGGFAFIGVGLGRVWPRPVRSSAKKDWRCSAFDVVRQRDVREGGALIVFFAGTDARAMPQNQLANAGCGVGVVSVLHAAKDRSKWPVLASSARATLRRLRETSRGAEVIVVAESLGALFALAMLRTEPNLADRLVLINPATAFVRTPFLRYGSSLLPLLRIDTSGNFLYPLASVILWNFLANHNRVATENVHRSDLLSLPAVDISTAPLDTTIHRFHLMRSINFSNEVTFLPHIRSSPKIHARFETCR